MKKNLLFIISILMSINLYAYTDNDMDGVDDAIDKCPNSLLTDLVDINGCAKESLISPHRYNFIIGFNYSDSDYRTLNATDTLASSLQVDYYYKQFSIQASTSYFKTDSNGLELLKSLRDADDKTPTIFISALVDMNSISKGFEVGADDYIKKPFFPEELLIRVNAKFVQSVKEIAFKNLKYLPANRALYIDEKIVSLGEVQECLCDVFMSNIGNVLDKSILMDCLQNPSDSALRVAINKFKQITGLEIKNIRGIGYILEKS